MPKNNKLKNRYPAGSPNKGSPNGGSPKTQMRRFAKRRFAEWDVSPEPG
jgi:hypothetical protein